MITAEINNNLRILVIIYINIFSEPNLIKGCNTIVVLSLEYSNFNVNQ